MTTVRMPRGKRMPPPDARTAQARRIVEPMVPDVCTLLPEPAREALVSAARTACIETLNATILRVKSRYPQFFRKD